MKNKISLAEVFILRVLLLICCFSEDIKAQDIPVNYVGWYSYNGYHSFNKGNPWALIAEGTIQRNNIIIDPMQWAYRLGLSYQLNTGDRIAVGYAFQYNLPYDDASAPYNAINRRVWEQYLIRSHLNTGNQFMFNHRFRLEQIWVQQKSAPDYTTTSGWKFENILRYQLSVNKSLNDKWGVNFYDEVFLNMYDFEALKLLSQNRIYAGVIYNIDKDQAWKISAGYMFQSVWNTKENQEGRKRINNVLRIAIIADLPFNTNQKKTN